MESFSGKITLITGGASGVGRLMARKMATRGTHAVLWDINDEALAKAAHKIRAAGGRRTRIRATSRIGRWFTPLRRRCGGRWARWTSW
jgi:NAD(P)-dependent dehydrogenase (short-subunit alcohol dehydrogenase family)